MEQPPDIVVEFDIEALAVAPLFVAALEIVEYNFDMHFDLMVVAVLAHIDNYLVALLVDMLDLDSFVADNLIAIVAHTMELYHYDESYHGIHVFLILMHNTLALSLDT